MRKCKPSSFKKFKNYPNIKQKMKNFKYKCETYFKILNRLIKISITKNLKLK